MPNYFTMKMREGTKAPDDREKVIDFLTQSGSIGIGEEEFTTGAGTFLNDMQIGDIIVLRAGRGPVALLKVVSDSYEYKSEGKFPAFDNWLAYARKVEVISWYEEFLRNNPDYFFDARGYLQTCAAITGDNLPIAQKWYETVAGKGHSQSETPSNDDGIKTPQLKSVCIEEINKITTIGALMNLWFDYCQSKWPNAVFVKDGPFPFYDQQETKILFIGREAYGMDSSVQNIDYWSDIRESSLGLFQSRLLYLAHGIINREYTEQHWLVTYDSGNGARSLNRIFAEDPAKCKGAFSYAFMNACKLVNTEGTKIGNTFRSFINDKVNRLFFIREIELLAPDIIVSANLNDIGFYFHEEFADIVEYAADSDFNNENCYVWKYKLQSTGKIIPCLDAWHFSAIHPNFEGYYQPICSAARHYLKANK